VKVKLGQIVYVVGGSVNRGKEVPCHICFGKMRVNLTLGNDEVVSVQCGACEKGFGGPTGVMKEYGPGTYINEVMVDSIKVTEQGQAPDITVYSDQHLFFDKATAVEFEKELKKDIEIRAKKWQEDAFLKDAKNTTWSASYSKGEIQRHQRSIDWHREKVAELPREKA